MVSDYVRSKKHVFGEKTCFFVIDEKTCFSIWKNMFFEIVLNRKNMFFRHRPKSIKNVKKRIPMNRWAKPDEYKKAIQFLCSDSSVYMTGQTLIIDGRRTAW